MAKKKVKKALIPFWKKHPELKSIADHIGKFIDRIPPDKWMDVALGSFLFYAGARTAHRHAGLNPEAMITGGGMAVLGYKLARAPSGGIVSVSQVAGLAILASIGILGVGADAIKGIVEEHSGFFQPATAEPWEKALVQRLQAGEELTAAEEETLRSQAMKRLVW